MSLKVVPFKSLGVVSYSPSIVTMAVSVAVCDIFSVKEWPDLENYDNMFSRFRTIPACYGRTDRQTDRRTDRHNCYINIARQSAVKAIKTGKGSSRRY